MSRTTPLYLIINTQLLPSLPLGRFIILPLSLYQQPIDPFLWLIKTPLLLEASGLFSHVRLVLTEVAL